MVRVVDGRKADIHRLSRLSSLLLLGLPEGRQDVHAGLTLRV
jgi:hypothetical protein